MFDILVTCTVRATARSETSGLRLYKHRMADRPYYGGGGVGAPTEVLDHHRRQKVFLQPAVDGSSSMALRVASRVVAARAEEVLARLMMPT